MLALYTGARVVFHVSISELRWVGSWSSPVIMSPGNNTRSIFWMALWAAMSAAMAAMTSAATPLVWTRLLCPKPALGPGDTGPPPAARLSSVMANLNVTVGAAGVTELEESLQPEVENAAATATRALRGLSRDLHFMAFLRWNGAWMGSSASASHVIDSARAVLTRWTGFPIVQ